MTYKEFAMIYDVAVAMIHGAFAMTYAELAMIYKECAWRICYAL